MTRIDYQTAPEIVCENIEDTALLGCVKRLPSGKLIGFVGIYVTLNIDGVLYRAEKLGVRVSLKKVIQRKNQ
jgi:hypothetical protein